MNEHVRAAAAGAALFLVGACGAERDVAVRSSAILSDGRTDGAPGFFFLPPVAPEPAQTVNDRGLSPVVEIVALVEGEPVLATFAGDAVKESGSHYMAHWSTKAFPPAADTTYRIRVLLDGVLLGFADAQVARDGRAARLLASDEIFPLTGKRTLPIKFRIDVDEARPDGDGDGVLDDEDLCPTVADPTNLDTDGDGIGDACECVGVECPGVDECNVGACAPETGACFVEPAPMGTTCALEEGVEGVCDGAGACVEFIPT